ncbi:hypothetical protein CN221_15570 [Sinorhizobium meliloti]|nr:hypothetical protein SMRU11_30965 [Sinorhizobium meliloti RU11/001]MBP2466333.1 thiamine phosphate synthase YjbQ (UPF0047 family) [Sinorhizobium meliloti]MQW79620.1 hypothetical protein [Sinorhizobium meliloti]RVG61039.1 hypothetical protein CN222_24610 [Sinorhizobium meliloti]RVG94694.1 hypothetical protein CN221_15570 [Sinorhizobium meliloti]
MAQTVITISTKGQGLYEFTAEADGFVRASGVAEGLLTVFVRHTSASLIIQENAGESHLANKRLFCCGKSILGVLR